ncbi:MAG TPA: DUF2911 domain-containing protein [Acidobacteriota bacterium]|nr:DUF2911 domain-containing protein [Acidobacteriota bacterium]
MRNAPILLVLAVFGFLGCSAPQEATEAPVEEESETTAMEESVEEAPARGEAVATIHGAEIRIDYGRPQLQGRDLKSQAQEGFVWRLGMNEATTLETSKDLRFGETTVPAGTYSIFARKGSGDEWQLIVNRETGLWGAFDHDPEQDIAEVAMETRAGGEHVETLTIDINSVEENAGEIVIRWGQDVLAALFTVP